MKAVVAAFNQEKALVGAFSVITNLRMELFEALVQAATVFWDEDPATSTIQRVSLAELQFPAVTVCPDHATPAHAVRTVLNMWVTRHSRHVSDIWQWKPPPVYQMANLL